jgi:hypothetical protein
MKSFLTTTLLLIGLMAAAQKPFSIGVVDSLYSKELQEYRRINVYLPLDIPKDSLEFCQVIYLLDGSKDEDFIHVAGLVQFCNFSWVSALPHSIVIGIENVDRRRDFTFPTTVKTDSINNPTSGKSAKFISFIEKELKPYVAKKYSDNPHETLVGQSLGGLLAAEILMKKPTMFDDYVIVSPSLWWDNESLFKYADAMLKMRINGVIDVHIAVGAEGKVMEEDARRLFRYVKKGKTNNFDGHFYYFPEKNHANIYHSALTKIWLK